MSESEFPALLHSPLSHTAGGQADGGSGWVLDSCDLWLSDSITGHLFPCSVLGLGLTRCPGQACRAPPPLVVTRSKQNKAFLPWLSPKIASHRPDTRLAGSPPFKPDSADFPGPDWAGGQMKHKILWLQAGPGNRVPEDVTPFRGAEGTGPWKSPWGPWSLSFPIYRNRREEGRQIKLGSELCFTLSPPDSSMPDFSWAQQGRLETTPKMVNWHHLEPRTKPSR